MIPLLIFDKNFATDHYPNDASSTMHKCFILSDYDLNLIKEFPKELFVYIPQEIMALIQSHQELFSLELQEGIEALREDPARNIVLLSLARFFVDRLRQVHHLLSSEEQQQIKAYDDDLASGNALILICDDKKGIILYKAPRDDAPLLDAVDAIVGAFLWPMGPMGPQGEQGPAGPQGPAGTFSGVVLDDNFLIVDATDTTKRLRFDVQGVPDSTTTFITNPSTNRSLIAPDIDGTILVAQLGTDEVFIGTNVPLHGSGSGIQYSSVVANRPQFRGNQYGNNAGIPGISTFKSRGTTIGSLAPVIAGDVIYRATAVGVCNNSPTFSIPLSGLISINVAAAPLGQGYIATDYELQLVSLDGPANGRRPVFKITSEGVIQLLESTSAGPHTTVPSGVVALNGAGTFTVLNSKLPANARILLTIQPGVAPTGTVYVSAITANTSFTITSNAGAADAGVNVYYQIYIPLA